MKALAPVGACANGRARSASAPPSCRPVANDDSSPAPALRRRSTALLSSRAAPASPQQQPPALAARSCFVHATGTQPALSIAAHLVSLARRPREHSAAAQARFQGALQRCPARRGGACPAAPLPKRAAERRRAAAACVAGRSADVASGILTRLLKRSTQRVPAARRAPAGAPAAR